MNIGQVKDIVRDNIGRRDLPTHTLDFILGSGRREIEKSHNFYWMRASKTFNLVIDQASYSITTSASGGLNLPNFKDVRVLFEKDPSFSRWSEVLINDFNQVHPLYPTDDVGEPEAAVIDNETLYVFPPLPDKAYNMNLYHWEWTENPDGNTESDEVTERWPELLIYAATAFGLQYLTHNLEIALPWQQLMQNELVKAKRYSDDRMTAERIDLTPKRGPFVYSVGGGGMSQS